MVWTILFVAWMMVVLVPRTHAALGSSSSEGRYSYSLTTFDPHGRLGQVERALEAAAHGTPIIAMVVPSQVDGNTTTARILLAAPQMVPSPFMVDDGTSRFVRITQSIVVSHSGIAADGRILVAAAQRMAMQHEYTFDEEMRIDLFLEEMSLLLQEYTMKAATRPFGAVLLVAHVPCEKDTHEMEEDECLAPRIYRIDPSGSVVAYPNNFAVIHGNLERTDLSSKLEQLLSMDWHKDIALSNAWWEDQLAALLYQTLDAQAQKHHKSGGIPPHMTLLTALLSSKDEFRVRRHELQE
jgi:20S proteasome alpha/beta subunit